MRHFLTVQTVAASSLAFSLALALGACSPTADTASDSDGDGSEEPGDGDGDGDGDPGDGDGDQGLTSIKGVCAESKVGSPILRRLTQGEVDATLREIFSLDSGWSPRLSADPKSKLGFSNDASTLVVGGTTARELLKTAEETGDAVVEQLGNLLPCSTSTADAACATEFVETYGRRLFHRPLTAEEITRYTDFQKSVADRSDFATGIKWATVTMIESPNAIYRSEIGQPDADGVRHLDNHEMAAELSYMMVGSPPDAALMARADAGELSDPMVRREEAIRLLEEHANRREGVRQFFSEWLKYRTVLGKSRDAAPNFADTITPLMILETREFLDALFFGKSTFDDLMTTKATYLDSELSNFYGYGGVAPGSTEFTSVEKPATAGMGILAQGSILAMTSHQDLTSPTQRGLLVTERFFCLEKPQVPANVPTIEETTSLGVEVNTTRETYEINHARGATCANCHLQFEPFGYLFEHFDETGRYRADEDGFTINTFVDNAPMPDGSLGTFADLDELSTYVERGTDIQACISGLMAAYMFSGGAGNSCLSEETRAQAVRGEISMYDLLVSYVEAPHFSMRK